MLCDNLTPEPADRQTAFSYNRNNNSRASNTINISSWDDFRQLEGDVSFAAGTRFAITTDLTLEEGGWFPLVCEPETPRFILDGQSHTLRGLDRALFMIMPANCVIRNLNLTDMDQLVIQASRMDVAEPSATYAWTGLGAFLNMGACTFENCSASGSIGCNSDDFILGGFVGDGNGASPHIFINCVSNVKLNTAAQAGGFLGRCDTGTLQMLGCVNHGNIDCGTRGYNYDCALGGLVGSVDPYVSVPMTVTIGSEYQPCGNYGAIDSYGRRSEFDSYVGGIIGRYATNGPCTLTCCSNYGNIENPQVGDSDRDCTGGIIGLCGSSNLTMTNCLNGELISGGMWVGGLIGRISGEKFTLTDNLVSFIDIASSGRAAGIACWESAASFAEGTSATGNVVEALQIGGAEEADVGRIFSSECNIEGSADFDNCCYFDTLLSGTIGTFGCSGSDTLFLSPIGDMKCGGNYPYVGAALRNGGDCAPEEMKHFLILDEVSDGHIQQLTWTEAQTAPTYDSLKPKHPPKGAVFEGWTLESPYVQPSEASSSAVKSVSPRDVLTNIDTVYYAVWSCTVDGCVYKPETKKCGCAEDCSPEQEEACANGYANPMLSDSLLQVVSSIASVEHSGGDMLTAINGAMSKFTAMADSTATYLQAQSIMRKSQELFNTVVALENTTKRKLFCTMNAICYCGGATGSCCDLSGLDGEDPTGPFTEVINSIAYVEGASAEVLAQGATFLSQAAKEETDVFDSTLTSEDAEQFTLEDVVDDITAMARSTQRLETTLSEKLCMVLGAVCCGDDQADCLTDGLYDAVTAVVATIAATENSASSVVTAGADTISYVIDNADLSEENGLWMQDIDSIVDKVQILANTALCLEEASGKKLRASLRAMCGGMDDSADCTGSCSQCSAGCSGPTGFQCPAESCSASSCL
ncbi:hypothetical protein AGMMS49992_24860 [Clostridia bacterium]|nr:hypothetical protein AGMMS49992_24860 [Clostridia bacterium]